MHDHLDFQSAKNHCDVDGCNSLKSDNEGITFFPCPQDPARCQQWKEILGFVGTHQYASLTPQECFNRLKICNLHFDKSSFFMSGKYLLNNAVPSKALVPKLCDDEVIIKPEAFCETEYLEEPLVKACYQESVDSRVRSSSTTSDLSYHTRGAQNLLPEIAESSTNLEVPVKKRLRFKDEDDIALLREVAKQNPFANPKLWDIIRRNVVMLTSKDFSLKTLKDHLNLLIELWCENKKALKAGFAVLQYPEKDQLCQDIFDKMWLFKGKDKKKTSTKPIIESARTREQCATIEDKSKLSREAVVESQPELIEVSLDHEYCSNFDEEKTQNETNHEEYLNDNSCDTASSVTASSNREKQTPETINILCPRRWRKRKRNIQEQYKKARIKLKRRDQALEAKKIALEERKLALEEKKLELSEKKLIAEESERREYLDVLEKQSQNIKTMVKRQDRIIDCLILQNRNRTI
ncbi:unnamed protein product [Ceutorhynchus assimilis]|uniref:THAP-type domain-containing protein n=1 Tax=Ceutorhynchus assimilis TaxID=467358 RepID=A0A9N9MS22_9CUCU|nr:unnamed protein product [Ceutorhynchus assimilis]